MTRAPSSVRIAATVLLPAPIPPVSPMIGAAIAAVAIPSRAASRGSPHVFNRLDHEVHDGDLVRHAVQLEATVKVLARRASAKLSLPSEQGARWPVWWRTRIPALSLRLSPIFRMSVMTRLGYP